MNKNVNQAGAELCSMIKASSLKGHFLLSSYCCLNYLLVCHNDSWMLSKTK